MSALLHHLLARLELWHDTLQHLGWLGVLGYAAGLVLLQMLFIPLAVFGVAAGAIFGFWKGVLAITIGTNVGAIVNFLLSRYVARGAVNRYLSHHEKFRLIDAAIGREGGKIIALLRLCPMPFGLANYCYGLTAIRFWPYCIATFLAIIPANCFFPCGSGLPRTRDFPHCDRQVHCTRRSPGKYPAHGRRRGRGLLRAQLTSPASPRPCSQRRIRASRRSGCGLA